MSTPTSSIENIINLFGRRYPSINSEVQHFLDAIENEFITFNRREQPRENVASNTSTTIPINTTHTTSINMEGAAATSTGTGTGTGAGSTANNRGFSLEEQIRRNQYNIRDVIDDYNYNMIQYNRNMEQWLIRYNDNFYQYQRNTANIINMLHEFQSYTQQNNSRYTPRNTRAGQRYTTRNTTNPLNWATFIPLRYTNTNRDAFTRLTHQQITSSTQNIEYTDEMTETRCPISWEDFNLGDQICQIRGCGHIFKPVSLMNWLQTNTHCPVCRYDLRTYTGASPHRVFGENDVSLNPVNIVNQSSNENPYNDLNVTTDVETIYTTTFDLNQNSIDNLDAILDSVMQQIGNDIVRSFDSSNNQYRLTG
jgi:hypothetical protein